MVVFDDSYEYTNEKTKETKTIDQKIIKVDGEDYRVPSSVLKALKDILEEKPDLKNIKVKRTGTGLNTSYTVVPLD